MPRTITLLTAVLAPALAGCCSTACKIPQAEYLRSTPEESFELFQRAAKCDDVDAAYATLTSDTKERISYVDFADIWSVAGDRIRALCHTEIEKVEDEPRIPGPAKKLTFRYQDIAVSFLAKEEGGKWLFSYPSPYHTEEELKVAMEKIDEDAGDCCE